MGFCSQDISEFSVMPNAARSESYSFMPCGSVHLLHFETLELWEPWNLFKKMTSKGNTGSFRHALLLTRHSKGG